MLCSPHVLLSCILMWTVVVSTSPLHFAVMSIPCYGHFMPLKAVAEELLIRGYTVSLFVERREWCETSVVRCDPSSLEGGKSNHTKSDETGSGKETKLPSKTTTNHSCTAVKFECHLLTKSHRFGDAVFAEMSSNSDLGSSMIGIFEEMFVYHEEQLGNYIEVFKGVEKLVGKVDLILTDLATFPGYSVAALFDVPYASMFPLTLHMPLGPATYLPSIGTLFPSKMKFSQRLINFLIKSSTAVATPYLVLERVNSVRRRFNVPEIYHAVELAGMRGLIFTPAIWGYDIPHPICPNVHAIGAVSPHFHDIPIESPLAEKLDRV